MQQVPLHEQIATEIDRVIAKFNGRSTTRIANLVDPAVLQQYFGDDFVTYQYRLHDRTVQGAIVPTTLAKKYLQDVKR